MSIQNNVLYDCAAFRLNPSTDAAIKAATKKEAQLRSNFGLGLTLILISLIILARSGSNISFASGIGIFISFGLGFVLLLEAVDDFFRRQYRPDFSAVYAEITAIGRWLGVEPEDLAKLDGDLLERLGDTEIENIALYHLQLEVQAHGLNASTQSLLVQIADEALAANRQRIGKAYERLAATRWIVRRNKGYGYHFDLARKALAKSAQ